ncbi:MAG: ABC transporter permease [Candidatus Acidiferrales bacterium]
MERMWMDVKYAARMLARSPGFTVAAVLTLALGIGANTAIFSVVNAVLLAPLPYQDGERLVIAVRRGATQLRTLASYPDFTDFRESGAFAATAAIRGRSFFLEREEGPQLVSGAAVSPDFFAMLGVAPAVGRVFTAEEAREPVVVISHELWERHFARNTDVTGQSLRLSGTLYRVTGVLPADYRDPTRPVAGRDVYVPMAVPEHDVNARNSQWLQVIARLRDDRTLEQARSIIEPASAQAYRAMASADPRSLPGFTVIPLREHQVGDAKVALWLILGAVGFVLLIGCANIASLLLARLTSRSDELAVRAAVGASRGRLAAQLITESLLLSVLGGIGALVFVLWGLDLVKGLSPIEIPWMERSQFDGTVFGFAFLAAMVCGLLFSALPAAGGARLDLLTALKAGKTGTRQRRALNVLLAGEVALTMTLLVGASLAAMSLARLASVDPGFESANILTVEMSYAGEWRRAEQAAFAQGLAERVRALPGVRYAGLVDNLPLSGSWSQMTTKADSYFGEVRPELQGQSITYEQGIVSGDYFRTMGIPLVKGRYFTPEDGAATSLVVIVSEDLARHLWGDADPLGRRVGLYDRSADKSNWATVVGVVGAIRHRGLDLQTNPTLYRLLPQAAAMGNPVLVLRGEQPERFAPAVREIARQLDAAVIVNRARPLNEILRAHTAAPRFLAVLLGSFALFALLLAAVGIYGVLSYAVSQRRQEIGIRMALGARPGEVMWMTVRGGMVFAVTGIVIGLGVALWLSRFMKTLLFEVSVADPAVYTGIAIFLAAIALLACWIPARRAARVDPMVALRYE